ncbi:MAG: undecaprenyl/decaprenyl-phosphate alpha-N-acetylglucosaminyl 1-phosphate transferase [Gammaproteobacteria bacterium]|nr:undecaprenyl/decaprenyl-phosphate alpha-N-acetylglucosaminyl 1-phosphate transferase [Gammaproteobacteria bacterium]
MNLLLAFIIAMAVTMALTPVLMRTAGRLHVLDAPGERKVHDLPMPRVGGIAMLAGVAVALLFWLPAFDLRMKAWLIGGGIVFAFGVWDDRTTLPPRVKLFGQLLGIACVVFLGGLTIDSFMLTERHALPEWFAVPFTFLFLLGATNAVNLADGLDGLAGGTTLLSCAALALLGLTYGVAPVAVTATAAAGSILGFLRFNTYPARVFMGDGGSQFLGYTVATLAILLTQDRSVPLSTALPLMLLGLPAVDTLMVMAQRWREGSPLFRGDRRHVHHKLLDLGFDHAEAVLVIYGMQAAFFVTAWQLRYEPDPLIVTVFVLMSLLIVGALGAAGRFGWRWRHLSDATALAATSPLRRAVVWLAAPARLPRWAIRLAGACLLAYVLAVALYAARPATDVGGLALTLCAVLLFTQLFGGRAQRAEWLARVVLYVGAAMAVYLDHRTPEKVAVLQTVKWLCLPLLVASVAVRIRLSSERRFAVTALDVLVIFAAAVVPLLPGLAGGRSDLGLSLLKLVAVVYAIELFTDQSPRGRRAVAFGICLFFAVAALRALH